MSSVGLVTVTPPELKGVTGEEIVKFDLAYDRYLRQISEVNLTRSHSQRVTAAGYKSCISSELLESMVALRVFEDCTEPEEVTNIMIKEWVKERSRCSTEEMSERVEDAVSRVKFKLDRADPQGSCLQFFTDLRTELKRNRVAHAVDEAGKALIINVIPKLEPTAVRDKISKSREFWSSEQRNNFHHFITKVTEECVQAARYIPSKRPRDDNADTKQQNHRHKKRRRDPPNREDNGKAPRKEGGPPVKDFGVDWTLPCLNKKCDAFHPMRKCEKTSPEEKKRLLKEYRERKRAERHAKKAAALRSDVPGDGRWEAVLEGAVHGTALGDSGSDYSAIDRDTVEELKANGVKVQEKKLENTVELDVAISLPDSVPFTTSSSIVLNVVIRLPCGPLRLRNVPFHIVDQKMDEILLGRPLLKALGYDVERHLSKLRELHKDIDVSKPLVDHFNGDAIKPEVGLKGLKTAQYHGLWYGRIEDDPIKPPESTGANIGEDTESEISEAFGSLLSKAAENGLTSEGREELSSMLKEYRDIFRIKMGSDPPAKVRPMVIRLRENYRPCRSTQRRYAPAQRAFISSTIRKLEGVKAVYANPTSQWASPALAVAKPGPEQFRFTVDLRGPNKETIPLASSMPDMEGLIQSVAGSTVFAKLDMCHAYWQIPLHPDSQECMSIQTPVGVFTPTRALHGSTDAGNHFQACLSEVLSPVSDKIACWLDDALVHEQEEAKLLGVLKKVFELCRKYGLKLHAKRCEMFSRRARFCGRIIDSEGVQFDPHSLETLTNMKSPEYASDLQQFLCAANWMRSSIPDFSRMIAPLHTLMEECYRCAGKRTKRSVRSIKLSELWGTEHDVVFSRIKQQIAHRVKLSHPKEGYTLCLFSDASDTHWASVLTQVQKDDMKNKLDEQDHEPLSFLSGSFTGSPLNWSIVEKEAYAVVVSMDRLEHITGAIETTIFTDHANLLYIFDPIGRHPGIGRHTASKLMRWALKLCAYRYVIEHVSGEENVWADMLTRWAVKPRGKVRAAKIGRVMYAPISQSESSEHDWPTDLSIAESQRESGETPPEKMKFRDGLLQDDNGVIFIPSNDDSMKLRILIAGHTGMAGHRGRKTTRQIIAAHFSWAGMREDISDFCKSCLHCLSSYPGETVPRPLGHSIHAERPNEVLHFDYCYIGPGLNGSKYLLVIKDDLSSYVWLVVYDAADAENTVAALVKWFSTFGVALQWISDGASHFKNEVMEGVRKTLKGSHHFTLPYCPWTNGTVEVVCRELVRCIKALLSEFKMKMKQWPSVVPLVQSALNNAPLDRLGGRSPLTVFTGLQGSDPVTTLKSSINGKPKLVTIQQARAVQLMGLETTQQALQEMHRDVLEKVSKARQKKIDAHNRKTHVRPCNLDVGDYALRGLKQRVKGRKLVLRWTGPYRVTKVMSDFLFQVEDLRSRQKSVVHGTRLKHFRNRDYEVSEECREQLAFQQDEYCVAEEIQDLRVRDGNAEVLVKWVGFEDEDPQWEPWSTIKEDIPKMTEEFIRELKLSGTARQKEIVSSLAL